MLKKFIFAALISSLLIANDSYGIDKLNAFWHPLADGLTYHTIILSNLGGYGKLHAFRIDLNKYQMQLLLSKNYSSQVAYVNELVKKYKTVLAVNGGFFSPDQNPLGLRINYGKTLSKIHHTAWWGIFYVKNHKAHILSKASFTKKMKAGEPINFAVQAGPIILKNGSITKGLKAKFAERTVLGIDDAGQVIMVVTQSAPIDTIRLAQLMRKSVKEGGLGCIDAINLDGGRSSQMYAKVGDFNLEVANFSKVTDAVVVLPRST